MKRWGGEEIPQPRWMEEIVSEQEIRSLDLGGEKGQRKEVEYYEEEEGGGLRKKYQELPFDVPR